MFITIFGSAPYDRMSNCDDQAVADQALDLFAEQTDISEENSKYALVG